MEVIVCRLFRSHEHQYAQAPASNDAATLPCTRHPTTVLAVRAAPARRASATVRGSGSAPSSWAGTIAFAQRSERVHALPRTSAAD
jgi:hypothetical protein